MRMELRLEAHGGRSRGVLRPHQRMQDSLGVLTLVSIPSVRLALGYGQFPGHWADAHRLLRHLAGQGSGPAWVSHWRASRAPRENLLPVRLLSAHSADITSASTSGSRILAGRVTVPASDRQLLSGH